MSQLGFDAATAKRLEAAYNGRDIVRRRALARSALAASAGHRVLDIGCGPGFYVTELLDEVGPNGSVVGLDSSADMLAIARHRVGTNPAVEFWQGAATALPGADEEFDRTICVQVLEYVQDVDAALAEMHRVLKPGGRVVVWDSDWSSVAWFSAKPDRMNQMLRAWDDHLVHPDLPRTLGARLTKAGFRDVQLDAHVFASTDLNPDGFVGALLPLVENFLRGHASVSADVVDEWLAEQQSLSDEGAFFFALIQCCFAATK